MTWRAIQPAAVAVFVMALVPALAMTAAVHFATERRLVAEMNRDADLAVDRVISRVGQHVVALRAARGLWSVKDGAVTREEFANFLLSVDIVGDLTGVRGIGYAPMVAAGEVAPARQMIVDSYGLQGRPQLETDQAWSAPVVLLEPVDERTAEVLGYDMYSDPTRRTAMDKAIATDAATMSAPINLVGGDDASGSAVGVLVYLPFRSSDAPMPAQSAPPVTGFLYAAFRGKDLIDAALASGPPLPLVLTVADSAEPDRPLAQGAGPTSRSVSQRVVTILGREWIITFHSTALTPGLDRRIGTMALAALSVLFALTMAYAIAARQHEAARARELAAASRRESEYRNLLLQEMKHRIKNYLTRVQSIARQSARGATDVKAFTETFDARLQSMAAVQEVLAGTIAAAADIRMILTQELRQCLETAEVDHLIEGPRVLLDERQSHAFAMVAHELMTNAMKYGGLSPAGTGLKVVWTTIPATGSAAPQLDLSWQEQFPNATPEVETSKGFGSRLIEASVSGELSGTLIRSFRRDGMTVTLTFPLNPDYAGPEQRPRSGKRAARR